MLYVIAWSSKATGVMGRETTALPLTAAQEECNRLNRECPLVLHWLEAVEDEGEPQTEGGF